MEEPVVAVMNRKTLLGIVLAGACLVASASVQPAFGDKKKPKTYRPPYKNGPQGGDEFNHIERARTTGSVQILRMFPGISPVVGCEPEPSAGWSMLQAPHKVTKRVKIGRAHV